MKKRLVVYGAFFVCVFFGGYLLIRNGATKANYDRITVGMKKAQIEYMLGGPLNGPARSNPLPMGGVEQFWSGNEGQIRLIFDEHDQIVWKDWDGSRPRETIFRVIFVGERVRE